MLWPNPDVAADGKLRRLLQHQLGGCEVPINLPAEEQVYTALNQINTETTAPEKIEAQHQPEAQRGTK
jgi:hypothetical protein